MFSYSVRSFPYDELSASYHTALKAVKRPRAPPPRSAGSGTGGGVEQTGGAQVRPRGRRRGRLCAAQRLIQLGAAARKLDGRHRLSLDPRRAARYQTGARQAGRTRSIPASTARAAWMSAISSGARSRSYSALGIVTVSFKVLTPGATRHPITIARRAARRQLPAEVPSRYECC